MDSQDSSSEAAAAAAAMADAANRDDKSKDEDDVLSATAKLVKDAALSFHSRKFAECVDALNQLLEKKNDDPKILHNIAISKFFQDGFSDPRKLLETLTDVMKRSDEIVHSSEEQVWTGSILGNKSSLGSKGTNNMVHQTSMANSSPIILDNEFDPSLTMLNIAIIWFHLQEYEKAFSILESLHQKIEQIDEGTALHICLLFLDVALVSRHPWKFIDVINYVEKSHYVNNLINQGDNGSSAHHQSSNLVAKSSSLPSNSTTTDVSISDTVHSTEASENLLSRNLSEETLEYETLFSTLDNSGQNLERSPGFQSSNEISRIPVDHSKSILDLRLKLHLYKVRFLLYTKNLKAAKREVKIAMNIAREVKMAMNISRGKDSSMALLLKSEIEYARGNYRKAVKLLMASGDRTELGISSIYNNNLGCIYFRLGKYHTSTVFFSKALSNSSSLGKEKPLKLSTFSQDKSLYIVYNCGLQYLACGNPILAARCFHKASFTFYNRPLLWLRLAECCLMAMDKGLLKSSAAPTIGSDVNVHVVGKGKWRQLVLEDGISGNAEDGMVMSDNKQPILSISLARQCLLNALHLLTSSELEYLKSDVSCSSAEEEESREAESSKSTNHMTVGSGQIANGDGKEQKGGNGMNATLQNSIKDYKEIYKRENQKIKQAIIANLAYVELELGNPLKALSAARSLLELPECSRIYAFLGHMYAAESLCLLNRPKEAADHLLIFFSGGNSIEVPYSEEEYEMWRAEKGVDCEEVMNGGSSAAAATTNKNSFEPLQVGVAVIKPDEARGILFANLGVLSAVQGDYEQAHRFVEQALLAIPGYPEAIVTGIYVDLMLGKTQEALAKLKKCSHIKFLPSVLTK